MGIAPARMLILCAPAGFDHFVLEMSESATDLTSPPAAPPDMTKLIALAAKYNMDIHGSLPEQPDGTGNEVKSDREEIETVREMHVAALNARDAAAWAGVFTEDAVQMPPNAPANVGKANIRSWAEGFLGAFRTEFSLSVTELQVVGDRAFESGAYSIALTPDGDIRSIEDVGKYITVYQRLTAGAWAVARDIWQQCCRAVKKISGADMNARIARFYKPLPDRDSVSDGVFADDSGMYNIIRSDQES